MTLITDYILIWNHLFYLNIEKTLNFNGHYINCIMYIQLKMIIIIRENLKTRFFLIFVSNQIETYHYVKQQIKNINYKSEVFYTSRLSTYNKKKHNFHKVKRPFLFAPFFYTVNFLHVVNAFKLMIITTHWIRLLGNGLKLRPIRLHK